MNRRSFALGLSAASAWASLAETAEAQSASAQTSAESNPHTAIPSGPPQQIGIVVYPQMTALDVLGPQTFLAGLGNVEVHLVWKDRSPIISDNGLTLIPSKAFKECPAQLDVLLIGGGSKGTLALMRDRETLAFLADAGKRAKYVTSVCTGSLVLGAAGLLRGYQATSHWAVRDVLSSLGAKPAEGRIVRDRNRITAGGVTAGIDFGLAIAAQLRSQGYAEMLQLAFEYDPQPPFHAGSPKTAPSGVREHMTLMYEPLRKQMLAAAEKARAGWSPA